MRIPPFEHYARWLSGAGIFIVGALAGSALFLSVYQHNFTIVTERNQRLQTELEESRKEVARLNKSTERQSAISRITVKFEQGDGDSPPDGVTENELRKRIARDMQPALGKPSAAIRADPLVYRNLVDGKIYPSVAEKDYLVRIRTMAVTSTELTVWVSVKPFLRH